MSFYIRKALLISSEILPVPWEKEKAVVGVGREEQQIDRNWEDYVEKNTLPLFMRDKRVSSLSMRRAFFKQHLPYSFPAAFQDWDQMGENRFHPLNQWYTLSTEGLHHQPPHTDTAVQAWQQESEAAKKVHPHPPPLNTHPERGHDSRAKRG